MDTVVIEDYYPTTIIDENVNEMKLTHLFSNLFSCLYIYFHLAILNSLF